MKKLVFSFIALFMMLVQNNVANAATASWYGPGFHGKRTANGEIFNQYALTAASNSHRMGTLLKVTNPNNGKSVIVRVTDTGGFGKYGRTLDLSKGAFSRIADTKQGVAKVKVEVLKVGDGKYKKTGKTKKFKI